MKNDDQLRGTASRKLTAFDRRQLQRDLATGDRKRIQLARDYNVSTSYISQFAKTFALEIDHIKRDLANEFAGLWIANKENRMVAYQAEYAMALGNDKRDHHEWIKARTAILHIVAEELGQLPPRATIAVVPVTHVIVGVDPSELT